MSGVTRERTREGVALMVSLAETVCGGMEESVIKADVGESKVGREMWVSVFACGSRSEKNETERGAFLNNLDDYLQSFGANVSFMLLRDLNTHVCDGLLEESCMSFHARAIGTQNISSPCYFCTGLIRSQYLIGQNYL